MTIETGCFAFWWSWTCWQELIHQDRSKSAMTSQKKILLLIKLRIATRLFAKVWHRILILTFPENSLQSYAIVRTQDCRSIVCLERLLGECHDNMAWLVASKMNNKTFGRFWFGHINQRCLAKIKQVSNKLLCKFIACPNSENNSN